MSVVGSQSHRAHYRREPACPLSAGTSVFNVISTPGQPCAIAIPSVDTFDDQLQELAAARAVIDVLELTPPPVGWRPLDSAAS